MKNKFLILLLSYFISSVGFTQNYKTLSSERINYESEKSIVFQQFKDTYDLVISKHNLSRNDKNEVFEIIAFKDNLIEKYIVEQNKKSKLVSSKKLKVSKKLNDNYQKFIDNLNNSNFFKLENKKINCWVENKDKSISIAPFDENLYYFEIIVKDTYKLLYSDCIENHPNAVKDANERERLKYWECLNIFEDNWK
ncbi:hypothetical protein [Lutibacter sp.]|uniref:hypothetical protein n=1 Tax=Lutibacter sp. TaxID=1925666 RepID=UPI0034A0743D